ncbi:hypothetical protein CU309_08285 [Prochlorococcus marinus str. MU1405]|nr:hypothetical protein [Prochlorococcus marinus str. MU1405]MBW3048299.1 hypothetical protein [Prochlorococcus marinus str. MU1406]
MIGTNIFSRLPLLIKLYNSFDNYIAINSFKIYFKINFKIASLEALNKDKKKVKKYFYSTQRGVFNIRNFRLTRFMNFVKIFIYKIKNKGSKNFNSIQLCNAIIVSAPSSKLKQCFYNCLLTSTNRGGNLFVKSLKKYF